jgi:hypothetical protein
MFTDQTELSDGRWDENLAQWLVGKYVLVGISVLRHGSAEVDHQLQIHGTIISVERGKSIVVQCQGARLGKVFKLPPDTAVFSPGSKQVYRLKSTGEEVDSPDAIVTWEVAKNDKSLEEFL